MKIGHWWKNLLNSDISIYHRPKYTHYSNITIAIVLTYVILTWGMHRIIDTIHAIAIIICCFLEIQTRFVSGKHIAWNSSGKPNHEDE